MADLGVPQWFRKPPYGDVLKLGTQKGIVLVNTLGKLANTEIAASDVQLPKQMPQSILGLDIWGHHPKSEAQERDPSEMMWQFQG